MSSLSPDMLLGEIVSRFGHEQSPGYEACVVKLLEASAKRSLSGDEVRSYLDYLSGGVVAQLLQGGDCDAAYAPYLAEIAAFSESASRDTAGRRRIVLPTEADSLASFQDSWSPIKALARLRLLSIAPDRELALVTTARNEGLYLLEWLAFHRAVGVQGIFVYSNDNDDSSWDLLRLLADAGEITLIENQVAPNIAPQFKAYEHALSALPELRRYSWVAFADVDEFLRPLAAPYKLGNLIADVQSLGPAAACLFLHWRWFGSGGKRGLSDEGLLTRFEIARADTHGKSICRLSDVLSMRPVHFPNLIPGRHIVNSELVRVDDPSKAKPLYGRAQVNHYWNKSFEEFVLKKLRGRATRGVAGEQRDYKSFFEWDARGNVTESIEPELLSATQVEYQRLLAISGVAEQQGLVRAKVQGQLDAIETNTGFDKLLAHAQATAGR